MIDTLAAVGIGIGLAGIALALPAMLHLNASLERITLVMAGLGGLTLVCLAARIVIASG